MARVVKKILPEYFQAIVDGVKTYELRLGNLEIEAGDTLVLEEWTDPKEGLRVHTGRVLEKEVLSARQFKLNELYWPQEDIDTHGLKIISFK